MKKSICRAFAIAFAVSIMLTTVIPASAAQPPVIMPAYVGITDLFSGLTISSNSKASCKATAYNNGTHDVTLTIALKQDGSTIKSFFNEQRPAYSLNYLTPVQFRMSYAPTTGAL